MRRATRSKMKKFLAGTAVLGGLYFGLRACTSSSPEAPKEKETIVDLIEKAVKGEQKDAVKQDIAQQYLSIFREGYARHPEEFEKYFTSRVETQDASLTRLLNTINDTAKEALRKTHHPREVYSLEKDGYTIANPTHIGPTIHLVKGKGMYFSFSYDGKDYVVIEKKDLDTPRLELKHVPSLRDDVDRAEPKKPLAYLVNVEQEGK